MKGIAYQEGTASVGSGNNRLPFQCQSQVVFIANDSNLFNMRVSFDGYSNQYTGILVKSGEAMNDIKLPPGVSYSDVSIEGIGGDVPYRILGA